MSMGNLARALHDELCEAFDCLYDLPDMDIGRPVVVRQTAHRYPREFWEGMAESIVDDYSRKARNKILTIVPCEHGNVQWCGSCAALIERGVLG